MVTDQNEAISTVRIEPPREPQWLERLCLRISGAVHALVPFAAGVGFGTMAILLGAAAEMGLDLLASLF